MAAAVCCLIISTLLQAKPSIVSCYSCSMKKLFILFLPMLWLLCACELFNKDAKPKLPPATMEGKGIFGCLINGKVFINEGVGFFSGNGTYSQLQIAKDTVGVNIYAESKTNGDFIISFYDSPALKINKLYSLAETKFYVTYDSWENNFACDHDSIISGHIKLSRFDLTNSIISGTFEFKAYSPTCQDTITITDGRFDIGEIER